MKIALFGTNFSENFNKYIQHLINKLEAENVKIYVEQFFYNYLEDRLRFKNDVFIFTNHDDLKNKADVLFSIGGDGTLLNAVSYVRDSNIPILGINTGRLGFLATIQKEKITESLHQILEGTNEIMRVIISRHLKNN